MAHSSASRQPPAPRALWTAAICAVAGLAVFQFSGNATRGYIDTASLFHWWGWQWVNPASETEHGWLILGLSVWLLWRNFSKTETGDRKPESFWPGVAAMAAGLALHAIGFAAQQTRISIIAFLIFIWGVLRFAGGRRWGGAALFPVAFMIFAIPFNFLDSIGFWLRMWVVDASGAIARAAGIGVLQSGTQLVAPDGRYNYDVAAACSGVRSLTAMVALSLLAGYLNFHSWWRRGLVFLACFPLVYLGNVARIVAIIFAAQWGGHKWGDIAHEVMGYGVFAIVLGGELGFIALLRRWSPEPEGECHVLSDASPAATRGAEEKCPLISDTSHRGSEGRAAGPYIFAAAGAVVGLAIGEMFFLHHLATSPPRGRVGIALAADGQNPVDLPALLGTDWAGRRAEVSAVEREILPPDTGYSRKEYVSIGRANAPVFLSLVLSGRDRTSIHRPEICLVGQGWSIVAQRRHEFRRPAAPGAAGGRDSFPATVLSVRREVATARGKEIVPQVVAYWFVGGDAIVATHWQRLLHDAWNRVVHGRADRWAYVLMQTDAADGEAAALARMQEVLNGTLPVFQPPLLAAR